jgi:hypothetical protein
MQRGAWQELNELGPVTMIALNQRIMDRLQHSDAVTQVLSLQTCRTLTAAQRPAKRHQKSASSQSQKIKKSLATPKLDRNNRFTARVAAT